MTPWVLAIKVNRWLEESQLAKAALGSIEQAVRGLLPAQFFIIARQLN